MEGPLVSDTTEFLSGAPDAPGETPLGSSASTGSAGPEGSHTGSRAPAGSDGAVAAKGTAEFVSAPYAMEVLPGVGHFIMDQAPGRATELLLAHIERHPA